MKRTILSKVLFTFSIFIAGSIGANAGTPATSMWNKIESAQSTAFGERSWVPQHYSLFSANPTSLKNYLVQAPMETNLASRNSKDFVLTLPLPDGSFQTYTLVESPIMEAPLAAAYPDIKTYAGQGIEDPTATIRCDITEFGFHAYVLSASGTLYIDPVVQGNTNEYIVYYKHDIPNGLYRLNCLVPDEEEGNALNSSNQRIYQPSSVTAIGTQLRTYRLALASTAEYTAFYGNTVAKALAGMVTTMNRVNGIYEKELCIHMNLVANDTVLIFTNSTTDPYTNSSGSTMLSQNQTACGNLIGAGNYDIGHVLSTGGGGIAGLGVVCNSTSNTKAKGVTGSSYPKGDPYDVDYVAHEMGHEFGGNHTFNSVTSSCSGGNRSASHAYEPGSGSTIMAYAGICGSDNLQSNSDAYFHTTSYDEIVYYTQLGTGNSCAVKTNTGNNPPTAPVIPGAYTIPDQTPFRLTATASDPDGDVITYNWEEFDLGNSGKWNVQTGNAPLFRSFYATASGTRLFPKLSSILASTTVIGEYKPDTTRTLHFRCTVRDNRAGGGGVNYSAGTSNVSVINTGTGFYITAPIAAGTTWAGFSTQTVTWNVSGSDVAPINATNVNIYLSTDNGVTFPITIATNVPNNGSYSFAVPNVATTTARIMVEGAGNIFFDINHRAFTITLSTGIDELSLNSKVNVYPNPASGNFHFVVNTSMAGKCRVSLNDIAGRTVREFVAQKNQSFIDEPIDLSGVSAGMYIVRFELPEGITERKLIVQ